MIEALIPIWIITKMDGTINCAHCLGCKAGLAESCSHIASLLFYLETWTKLNGRLLCTKMKCSLILPNFAKEVEYARVQDKSAKKMKADLDATIENIYPVTTTLPRARTSLLVLKALFRNRKYQCHHKWKWNAFTLRDWSKSLGGGGPEHLEMWLMKNT